MEQQHTQEPWRANDAQADIDGLNGEPVAVCYCNDDKGDDAIANARRIVACVNACAGISTELLEECKTLSYSAYNMIRDVEKQRDELLAALNKIKSDLKIDDPVNHYDLVCAAIASVKPDHFRDATKMIQGGADAPADIDDGFVGRIDDAITEALGDAMDCTRVWAAWGYGTMGQDDFVRVADDPGRVMEIRDAVLRVVRASWKDGAA